MRINLHPFRDNGRDGGEQLKETYLKTLDWAVAEAQKNQLLVILDFHEFTAMAREPLTKKERFLATWTQLAERYRNQSGDVLFEILNEPNGSLTAEHWNQFLKEALAVIRRTNPTRTVIVGPAQWNNIRQLKALEVPEGDRNIIVTVHYYSPMEFTHQGASWTGQRDKLGISWDGTPEQEAAVKRDFDQAEAWAQAARRPLYLGEFGAYDKAEMPSRVRYLRCVARQAEARKWSWAYWQFDNDFILYDIAAKHWINPIREVLIPAK